MLVLGRKEDQRIRFPSLGISIEILRIKNSSVSVGIEAPSEFRIIRDEITDYEDEESTPNLQVFRLPSEVRHDVRNQLNQLSIALALFRAEIDGGLLKDAETTFEQIMRSLHEVSTSKVFSRQGIVVPRNQPCSALLIEDQANEREMLAGFLRMQGYVITTVSNGQEALEYLSNEVRPELALVDMGLPELDGPATIRQIREVSAFDEMRIYGLSGRQINETGLDFESDRIDGWFMKPLDPHSLVEMLASTCVVSAA